MRFALALLVLPALRSTAPAAHVKGTWRIDAVRVDAYAFFCWYGTCVDRQITEAVSWHY